MNNCKGWKEFDEEEFAQAIQAQQEQDMQILQQYEQAQEQDLVYFLPSQHCFMKCQKFPYDLRESCFGRCKKITEFKRRNQDNLSYEDQQVLDQLLYNAGLPQEFQQYEQAQEQDMLGLTPGMMR